MNYPTCGERPLERLIPWSDPTQRFSGAARERLLKRGADPDDDECGYAGFDSDKHDHCALSFRPWDGRDHTPGAMEVIRYGRFSLSQVWERNDVCREGYLLGQRMARVQVPLLRKSRE